MSDDEQPGAVLGSTGKISKFVDPTGQRFSRLIVLKEIDRTNPKLRRFLCMCDCGKTTSALLGSLRSGHTRSCGCLKRETTSNINAMSDDDKLASVKARLIAGSVLNDANGCHEWEGCKTGFGYGAIQYMRKKRTTHRLTWELFVGQIPDGLCVLHRCDNPKCNNIAHLFLGTDVENVADRDKKGRQWKPKGELNPMFKVTAEMSAQMKLEYLHSPDSVDAIAKRFGVCKTMVARSGDGEKRGTGGSRNGRAKLTPKLSDEIRLLAKSGMAINAIGRQVGLSWPTVKRVLDGVSFV